MLFNLNKLRFWKFTRKKIKKGEVNLEKKLKKEK